MTIKSIEEIATMLRQQADLRAPENDEAGILQDLADQLEKRVADLELGLRAVRFTFADDDVWDGFADGSTWNGFDNIWIMPETRDAVAARWRENGDSGEEGTSLDDLLKLPVGDDGLVCLGWCFATSIWDKARIEKEIRRIGRA